MSKKQTSKKLPEITPSEFKNILSIIEKMSNPPAVMVYGMPGIGKTQIIKKEVFGDASKYEVRVKYLSRMDPSDWSGIPEIVTNNDEKVTEFVKIKLFSKPENGKRLVIFFDELNTAMPQVLNSALDIILEKKNDNVELPEDTIIIAAGNLGEEDGTYVENLSSAVKTRLVQFVLVPSVEDWLKWAKKAGINQHIIDFIGKKGIDYLIDINGFKNDYDQIATPRGWERVSEFMKKIDIDSNHDLFLKICQGILGEKIAEEFISFLNTKALSTQTIESQWKAKLLEVRKALSGALAYQNPTNISNYIIVINEGLEKGYKNAENEAKELTNYLIEKNFDQTMFAPLRGKNVNSYISYLEMLSEKDKRVNDIIKKIKGESL